MATLQVDGSAVTKTSTRNSGGAGINTSSSSVLSKSLDLGYPTEINTFGSTVVDGSDTDKAVEASGFANNTQRPIAKRLTSELGSIVNSVLLSGAAQPTLVKSVNSIETIQTLLQTTAYRDGQWNIFTGFYNEGYPLSSNDDFGADNAARVSRTSPGKLAYRNGSVTPVSVSYPTKTA